MRIAIITMIRKGSKRLPNKNIMPLNNIPLYQYTVNMAVQLGYDYYFLHDYDNIELPASVKVIKRKAKFTGSNHRTNEEIIDYKIEADIYILLQVTSPIRSSEKIKKWVNDFILSDLDIGLSAVAIKNKYVYNDDCLPVNFAKYGRTDNGTKRDNLYIENGAFYIFKKHMLEKQHIMLSDKMIFFEDDNLIDIDTIEDLREAEKYFKEEKKCYKIK